jgi:cbb3-type cytochrome oxidase maturation protein
MMWSMLLLIVLTLAAGFAGWLFFLWAVKSGQYDDIEGPKYRMLEDEEDEKIKAKSDHDDGKNNIRAKEPD